MLYYGYSKGKGNLKMTDIEKKTAALNERISKMDGKTAITYGMKALTATLLHPEIFYGEGKDEEQIEILTALLDEMGV